MPGQWRVTRDGGAKATAEPLSDTCTIAGLADKIGLKALSTDINGKEVQADAEKGDASRPQTANLPAKNGILKTCRRTDALASDVRHVVKCLPILIADVVGLNPGGYGSPSCDGEQDTEEEGEEVRLGCRRKCVGESFGKVVKQFDGLLLSFGVHRSWFGGVEEVFANNPIHQKPTPCKEQF